MRLLADPSVDALWPYGISVGPGERPQMSLPAPAPSPGPEALARAARSHESALATV